MTQICSTHSNLGYVQFSYTTYRIYSRMSRKSNDKIMPQKLEGRLISGSILAGRLDLLLRLSWNVIIAH